MQVIMRNLPSDDSSQGNILIGVIIAIFILSLLGGAMTSRLILDADSTTRRLVAERAFYLADSGIQWGRKQLSISVSDTTLGAMSIGGGTVTVTIDKILVKYSNHHNNEEVYKITSTASVGQATRKIEEFRFRDGGNDKELMLWRESITDEY